MNEERGNDKLHTIILKIKNEDVREEERWKTLRDTVINERKILQE